MGDNGFELEPSPPFGQVPERVIDELRVARRAAVDYAQAFGDAIKAAARGGGVSGINPSALDSAWRSGPLT